jgi:hypothetical protein
MTVLRLVAAGVVAGAAAAFVAALLRPRRPGGYDPFVAVGAQPAASW